MAHAQHSQSTQLLRAEKYYWWESTGHFAVEAHFDSGLNFVLHFNQQVKKSLSVDYRFSEVGHQPNQSCVPLVGNFSKSSGARSHQYLSTSIFELFNCVLLYLNKRLSCYFLSRFILQFPHTIFLTKFLHCSAAFGLNSNLKATHIE